MLVEDALRRLNGREIIRVQRELRLYRLAHHRGDKHQLSRHADPEHPGLLSEA